MRRIILTDTDQQTRVAHNTGSIPVDIAASRIVDRNRRSIRSQELIEAVQRLDVTTDPAAANAIMKWINDEYANRQGGTLLGLFSRCYLGDPYVDHRLDLSGGYIVEHYTRDQSPPAPFQGARPLARSNAYIYIEVYDDGTVVPVRADGRPVI